MGGASCLLTPLACSSVPTSPALSCCPGRGVVWCGVGALLRAAATEGQGQLCAALGQQNGLTWTMDINIDPCCCRATDSDTVLGGSLGYSHQAVSHYSYFCSLSSLCTQLCFSFSLTSPPLTRSSDLWVSPAPPMPWWWAGVIICRYL